jgi:hypothetical protein
VVPLNYIFINTRNKPHFVNSLEKSTDIAKILHESSDKMFFTNRSRDINNIMR